MSVAEASVEKTNAHPVENQDVEKTEPTKTTPLEASVLPISTDEPTEEYMFSITEGDPFGGVNDLTVNGRKPEMVDSWCNGTTIVRVQMPAASRAILKYTFARNGVACTLNVPLIAGKTWAQVKSCLPPAPDAK